MSARNDLDWSEKEGTILREIHNKASQAKLHYAVLFWISPFGNLDYRVGYFEDYTEARQFAKYLYESCFKANGEDVKCTVYLDGHIVLK